MDFISMVKMRNASYNYPNLTFRLMVRRLIYYGSTVLSGLTAQISVMAQDRVMMIPGEDRVS